MKTLLSACLFTVLFVICHLNTGCQKQSTQENAGHVLKVNQAIQFLKQKHSTFADSISVLVDFSTLEKVTWKYGNLAVVHFKRSTANQVKSLILEYRNDSIVSGNILQIDDQGGHAQEILKQFLKNEKPGLTGSIRSTQLNGVPSFHNTYRNAKPVEFRFTKAQPRKVHTETGIDDPTDNCVDWYWVTYNSETGEIYSAEFLYTICDEGGSGGGGGGGGGGEGNNYYTDPCAQARGMRQNAEFKTKMETLRSMTGFNYETMYVGSRNAQGGLSWSLATGQPNTGGINYDFSGYHQNLTNVMHTHPDSALSVFSPADIRTMFLLIYNGRTESVTDFSMSIVTASGTTYTLIPNNLSTFISFGQTVFNSQTTFDNFNLVFDVFFNIKPGNTPEQNEANFINLMKSQNMGLTLFKGNINTMNTWVPIITSNNQIVFLPCN